MAGPDKLKVVEGENSGEEFVGEAVEEPTIGETFKFNFDEADEDGNVAYETEPVTHITEKPSRTVFRTKDGQVLSLEDNEKERD